MKNVITIFVAVLMVSCSMEPDSVSNADLEKKVDALVQPYFDGSKIAGIAIGIFKGDEKLLLKSYGFADLEFDVKLPTDASFEIGSVTKQFTAVAILQLVQEGKLSLDDDATKYVTFDTKGKKVTVRQLLNHTSGIKGYTELPFFEDFMMRKYKRDTLLRMVEKEPFDFEPGEVLIYNNTAFFMLGLIIEKLSGLSYEEYLSKKLFTTAGMKNTYYCSENKIVKNRAHGYELRDSTLVRAPYLDHTWPYSAGSLCSTVEDLVKWNNAVHKGKMLDDATYNEFIKPTGLNDGTITKYAKGITVRQRHDRRVFEHGGAIPGFLSENSYYPDDDVSIVVLANTMGPVSPEQTGKEIAAIVFKTAAEEKHRYNGSLDQYLGTFKGRARGTDLVIHVSKNDTTILIQEGDGKPFGLSFVNDDAWTNGYATYNFTKRGDAIDELRIDEIYNYYILKKEK